jgi:hypothetical protein
MAQRTVIRLVDDLDNSEIVDGAGQTVSFALDGRQYEIDLTNEHADELRAALDRYVHTARKVGARQTRARASAGEGGRPRQLQPPGRPRVGQGKQDRCLTAWSCPAERRRSVPRRRQLMPREGQRPGTPQLLGPLALTVQA